MPSFALFTDGSCNTKAKIGVGAFLILPTASLDSPIEAINRRYLAEAVRTKIFVDTSSTKLEIETTLWALEEVAGMASLGPLEGLSLYTDSQGVEGLLARRAKLEANHFLSRKTHQELKLAPLYRKFYQLFDHLSFDVIKVPGHSPKRDHTTTERLFSIVDQAARKTLLARCR